MPLFSVPLKKTQNVEVIKPLSHYIKNTFSQQTLDDNKDALAEFSQLRANAVVRALDKHETSLEVLQRYYDQLCAMEAKLPIAEDQIRISFNWYDAFDKGSLFGVAKYSMSSIAYEKCCVLFNIGALYSQLASSQNLSTDDGLKTAAKYVQQASGIFAHLKDIAFPQLQTLPTPDFSVDCLGALSAIMHAQAQDCFYQKAVADNMKDASTAKLAAQAADLYQEAARQAGSSLVRGMWDKDWIPVLNAKNFYFLALAEYHQALVAKGKSCFGEAVARSQKAEQQMNSAVKSASSLADFKVMADKVSRLHAECKKDNDFIYLDRVPAPDSLPAVGRAAIAKPTPMPNQFSSKFTDLFAHLVPMAVHQALATYDTKKSEIVNREIGRLREATQMMNGLLASLNLPAAIEDLSGSKVPQSVLEKSAEVRDRGGHEKLDQMMQDLPELLERNREILDETVRMMDEEQDEDAKMRERFKEKWNRTPSAKLTEQLRAEVAKYRGILDNAIKADAVVKERYNSNRRGLDILCKSEADIAAALPKSDASASTGGSGTVSELRTLMNEVAEIKTQREKLEEEFKSATVDISSKFLSALAADGVINAESISDTTLHEVYASLEQEVESSISRQDQLIAKVQDANQRFLAEKQGSGAAAARDQMLRELASAYDAFSELISNLTEGTKFYNDLTPILLKFQNKVSDLVFARRTEKEDLSRDIQQMLSKSPPGPAPNVPAHHRDQPKPPERPPPPQFQGQPQSGAPPAPGGQPVAGQQPPVAAGVNPYYPSASAPTPYPSYPGYMPQPGYYAPPGGLSSVSGGYGAGPYPQQYPYPGGYPQMPYQGGYGPSPSTVGYGNYPQQRPPTYPQNR